MTKFKNIYKALSVLAITGVLNTTAFVTNASAANGSNDLNWNNTNDPSLKGQTITVLWTENPAEKELAQAFTKQTGIKVKLISLNYNSVYDQIMTVAMSNTHDVDVNELNYIWTGAFDQGHVDVGLSNVIPKSVQTQWTTGSREAITWNGQLMGVPWYTSTKHFYWNPKLLREAGISSPPKTWDQFENDSIIIQKKLGKKGIYASGWSWKQSDALLCDFASLLGAYGGHFYSADGKPDFNSAAGVRALSYMVQILKNDKTVDPASLQWTENDVTDAFSAGKIAMMSNWEGQYAQINNPKTSSVVGQIQVGLMPGTRSAVSSACSGSEGLAIMQNSNHKEAALAFLKFVISKRFQLDDFSKLGIYPSVKADYRDPSFTKAATLTSVDPLSGILPQYSYSIPLPMAPGSVQAFDIIEGHLHRALLGQETPKQALDGAIQDMGNQ